MRKSRTNKTEERGEARDRHWTWFFRGFGVGFALAVFVASLVIPFVLVPWLRQELSTQVTPATVVHIIPDISMPIPGEEVTLTPILDGQPMLPPIRMVWSADCGEGLPRGLVAVKSALWTAPVYTTEAHIGATVSDAAGSVAKGSLILPVVTSSPPVRRSER